MIKCKDCNGLGSWEEREDKNGEVALVVKYCNTCHGSGRIVPADEEDVYDIDGEGDDDE